MDDGRLSASAGLHTMPSPVTPALRLNRWASVHADFRQRGLAKALLHACFQRMQRLGAQQVLVGTDNDYDAAFHLYEAVDFRVQDAVLV